jgi:cytochrome P450
MAAPIDIFDPDSYIHGPPHAAFEELRRSHPVYWQETPDRPGMPGYWAVLKHADILTVSRSPRLFSAEELGTTLDRPSPEQLEMSRNMLVSMDPPRHGQHRRPVAGPFKRRTIAQLEHRTREIARTTLNEAAELCAEKGQVDFVEDVCGPLPTQVFGEIAGLPRRDWAYLHRLAEEMFRNQDPDVLVREDDRFRATGEMFTYAVELAAQRRREPRRDDLTSLILESNFGGQKMTDVAFGSFVLQLIVAGNDTSVSMLSSGLLTSLQHPEHLAELRADPSLIPEAVEEILRWANPVHYMARTATADIELRGVPIKAGDRLALYYTSANRDEDVFHDPQLFDIRRSPNPHLAFGIGEHFCLGAHLTRLEGKVFFEELLAQFPILELAGEPKHLRHNHNNALKQLPIVLSRA